MHLFIYFFLFSLYLGSELVVVLNDGEEIRDVLSRKESLARPPNSPFTFFGVESKCNDENFSLMSIRIRNFLKSCGWRLTECLTKTNLATTKTNVF